MLICLFINKFIIY